MEQFKNEESITTITMTFTNSSFFKALVQSNLETWIVFQTGALSGSEKGTTLQRKFLPAGKRIIAFSSLFSLATSGIVTASSWRTWIVGLIPSKLDLHNLNNVGDAHP